MSKRISRTIVVFALTLPVYVDRASAADTTAQHAADNLLNDNDGPKPDLVIDVTVMEVSRERLRTLGVAASRAGAGSFAINASGASFASLENDRSNVKVVQKQILTLDYQEATLKIGDRLPIAMDLPREFGFEKSPIMPQFRYVDVGLSMDITPHIESASEVTLKMALDISSAIGSQTIGGITQPVIGQRRIEREIRIADGDVYLLRGIIEQQETQSFSGYPWINKIPVLRCLFGQDNKEYAENEIVFALAPHIWLR